MTNDEIRHGVRRTYSAIRDAMMELEGKLADALKAIPDDEPAPEPGSVEQRLLALYDAHRALTGPADPYTTFSLHAATPDLLAYALERRTGWTAYDDKTISQGDTGMLRFQFRARGRDVPVTIHSVLNPAAKPAEIPDRYAGPKLVDSKDELVIVRAAEPEPAGESIPPPPGPGIASVENVETSAIGVTFDIVIAPPEPNDLIACLKCGDTQQAKDRVHVCPEDGLTRRAGEVVELVDQRPDPTDADDLPW